VSNPKSLPLYKTILDLLEIVSSKTKEYKQEYKHTLGTNMFKDCTELMYTLFKASAAKHKEPHIEQMIELITRIEMASMVSKDLHLINVSAYAEIMLLVDSVIRQSTGWLNKVKSK
jgi:hypothetical protein